LHCTTVMPQWNTKSPTTTIHTCTLCRSGYKIILPPSSPVTISRPVIKLLLHDLRRARTSYHFSNKLTHSLARLARNKASAIARFQFVACLDLNCQGVCESVFKLLVRRNRNIMKTSDFPTGLCVGDAPYGSSPLLLVCCCI
jgi:hypothetical protein